ncbi:MAG: NAD(P)-dependent oxidoreductase [Gemmatimonadetes bacterium]|nr:NAD(P)-dependent oxidoreductase [Gemmatimonadota bacterium]
MNRSVAPSPVGFIGVGSMGSGMARNLLKAGLPLLAYDTCREALDRIARSGARTAENLTRVGGICERIVLMLPDTRVVEDVLFGDKGLKPQLKAGHIIIDCGTTHPDFTREASRILADLGVHFLDAPCSGMSSRAADGTLTLMVGGDKGAHCAVEPLLNAMGSSIYYMGASGNGQLAKIVNNTLFNISCAALAEMLPLTVRLGLDAKKMCGAVMTGSGQSYGFDTFAPLILERNFEPGYPMANARKDVDAITGIMENEGVRLPLVTAAADTFRAALDQGMGNLNKGGMIQVWEAVLGVKVQKAQRS